MKFLTSMQGQLEAFREIGNLPSNLNALADPTLQATKDPYFSNAPTGVIFGAGAKSLKPVYLGPKNQAIRDEVESHLHDVENGRSSAGVAWQQAVADAATVNAKAGG